MAPGSGVVLSELEESDGGVSVSSMDDTSHHRSQTSVTAELKARGIAVLLHVGVGRIEPGSITLHERTGKLVVRTDRSGWWGFFHCCCLRHEFGPGELEPVPRRVWTRRLHRSVAVLSGGDPAIKGDLLQRSLSLIRRYPIPDSVDLTFLTAEDEERLRLWANDRLTVNSPQASFRQSSRHVAAALQGKTPGEESESETSSATVRTESTGGSYRGGERVESVGDDEEAERLLPGTAAPAKKKSSYRDQGSAVPTGRGGKGASAMVRRKKSSRSIGAGGGEPGGGGEEQRPSAASGADDEDSDVNASKGVGARPVPSRSVSFRRRAASGDAGGKVGSDAVPEEERAGPRSSEELVRAPASAEKPRRRTTARTRRSN